MRTPLFIAALVLIPPVAGAGVFKCEEEGKTVYQEYPCRGAGAAINVVPPHDPMATGKDASIERDTITANRNREAKILALNRRLLELDDEAKSFEAEIGKYQAEMAAELDLLRKKQEFWKNKPGGSNWEQGISAEMKAVPEKYNARIQAAQGGLARLAQERDGIYEQIHAAETAK